MGVQASRGFESHPRRLSLARASVPRVSFEAIVDAVRAAMQETATPGVAVGIWHKGEEHVAGLGVTSVENPLEVTPDTLFQIGSITKTFTATTAMALVEQGKLDLDAPVRTYLPELKLADESVAQRVTTRHLLTHMGGWVGDYFDDTGPGDDAVARIVERFASLPQLTPLGEVWSYNNAGFYLAGRVIEVLAGKPYEQVVKEVVLLPLGLHNSFFFAEEVMTRRFAVGHLRNENGPPTVSRMWEIGRAHHAAGAIASTVPDLLRYARFHMSHGEGVLSRASLDEMQRVQVDIGSAHFEAVGLSWAITNRNGVRLVGHGGGTSGQISLFVFAPEHDFALACFTNHQRGGEVNAAARKVALEMLGVREPERRAIELDPEEYLGTYTAQLNGATLSRDADGLVLTIENKGGFPHKDSPPAPNQPPMRVAFYEPDRLFVVEGPSGEAEFLRSPDGSIAWFRIGGRVMSRV
jgi:CubicO group peptidase (beta-lactamase class C family)